MNKIADYCGDASVLKEILGGVIPSQSAFNRFFSSNGLVTPLFWRIWVQDKDKLANAKLTKIELAKDMLRSLREDNSVRLWVAMDRWFLCKDLFQWLNSKDFDWVTKCKRNTALYKLNGLGWKGNPRYSPVKPGQLLALNYVQLIKSGESVKCSALSIPDIYI